MRLGFYFDQSRCSGCDTCVVACKDWHDVAAGPASWIKIETIEKGRFPDLSVSFLFTTCFHCADAPCIRVCPVDAMSNNCPPTPFALKTRIAPWPCTWSSLILALKLIVLPIKAESILMSCDHIDSPLTALLETTDKE